MEKGSASASRYSTRRNYSAVASVKARVTARKRIVPAVKAGRWPQARPIARGCEHVLPWSAPTQHAGRVAAVIDGDGNCVRILRLAAEPCRGTAGGGKRPWRVVGLLYRRSATAAAPGDDGGIAGLGQLDAFKAGCADRCGAALQIDDGLAALGQDIERGTAHADGGQRRRDLVGGLVRMPGDKTKRARGHAHRDFAIVSLV